MEALGLEGDADCKSSDLVFLKSKELFCGFFDF